MATSLLRVAMLLPRAHVAMLLRCYQITSKHDEQVAKARTEGIPRTSGLNCGNSISIAGINLSPLISRILFLHKIKN